MIKGCYERWGQMAAQCQLVERYSLASAYLAAQFLSFLVFLGHNWAARALVLIVWPATPSAS